MEVNNKEMEQVLTLLWDKACSLIADNRAASETIESEAETLRRHDQVAINSPMHFMQRGFIAGLRLALSDVKVKKSV